MSTPDINLYSYNGPDHNGAVIDTAAHNPGYQEASDGLQWSDTLKFTSQLQDTTFMTGIVYGGSEDCADFNNRCSNLRLRADEYHSGGKYVTTVKGGCTGIDIRGLIVTGGSEVDHDFGNWSDQSSAKTTGNILGTWKADGRPVTVRVLNGTAPMFVKGTGPYVYLFPHPDAWYHGIAVWFFMTFRRFWR